MASRVNTKFVLFLVLALGAAGVVVGGLYYLNIRANAERAVRRGDEALQKGELRAARDFYIRAVLREPGNLGYLQKLEDTTLNIQPRTTDEATDLYRAWVGILAHGARHDSANAQRHMRFLREMSSVARRTNSGWDTVLTTAKEMWERLPENDPQRPLAKVYQAMAVFRRVAPTTPEEYAATEAELEAAVQALANHDLAWATLIQARMILLDKMKTNWGRTGAVIQEQNAKIDDTIRAALLAVPNGPEVAMANLHRLLFVRKESPAQVTESQISDAADHLMTSITDDMDIAFVLECAGLLPTIPNDGVRRAIALGERYLQIQPDALDMQLNLSLYHVINNDLGSAERLARQVVDSEPLPVCFAAQYQPEYRTRAAGMLVDIKAELWSAAAPEDRPALAAAMDEARERLASLAKDKTNDPQLLRADARLAYFRGDYARAAKLFDTLVRHAAFSDDPQILYFAAVSLQQIQQFGRAYERVEQALKVTPGNPSVLLLMKARLEIIMGRRSDAAATMAQLPADVLEQDEARQLLAVINTNPQMAVAGGDGAPANAVATAVATAGSFLSKGDVEGARTTLVGALSQSPQNMVLLKNLMLLEVRTGQIEKANDYLAQAKKLPEAANDVQLLHFDAVLKHSDPIEAIYEFHKQAIEDETERTLSLLDQFKALANEQHLAALRLERTKSKSPADAAAALQARELSQRAAAELRQVRTKAEQLAPNHPRFLDHQLDAAVESKDWAPGGAVDRVLTRARELDSDQAGGMFFKGRAEISHAQELLIQGKSQEARQKFQQAARSLEIATERISFHARAWRALAHCYQQLGNFAQAQRAHEQAYKCNPTDLDVARSYVDYLMRRGDQARLLTVLREIRQLWPNEPAFRSLVLQLEAEAGGSGGRNAALNARRAVYKEHPDDLLNAEQLIRLLSTTEPTQLTILDSSANPLYTERRWTRMSVPEREQAILQARAQWNQEIESMVQRLEKQLGANTLEVVRLHASVLRERGEIARGETLLQQFIAGQGAEVTADMLLELARYQVSSSHYNEAVETFKRAIDLQDPIRREADLELGQLYMTLRVPDRALEHFNRVLETNNERNPQQMAIECLIRLRQFEEAERRLQELVRASGDDLITILLQANIAESQGDVLFAAGDTNGAERKYATLRDILNRAQAHDPTSPAPRLMLAQFLLRDFQRGRRPATLDDALVALAEAEKLRADQPNVSLTRIMVFKEKGDRNAAIGELRRFVDRQPDNHSARGDLAQMYVQDGRPDEAFALLDEAIRRNPTLSVWYDLQGDLHKLTRSDPGLAMASYLKAYELSATPTGLLKVADATLAMKNPDCRGLINRITARASDLETNPLLREVYARALHCANRQSEAMEQMKLAYEVRKTAMAKGSMNPAEIAQWFRSLSLLFVLRDNPGQLDASAAEQAALAICGPNMNAYELRGVANLYMVSGDPTLSRALDLQRQAIAAASAEPQEFRVQLYSELAAMYYGVRRIEDAVAAYDAIIEIDPNNITALNNSAYMSAEELKNPQKAIPLVERIIALAGHDAAVLDTAGWTYYLAGDHDKAHQTLVNSYQARKTLVTCMHLIEVLLKRGASGDLIDAQKYLDEAMRMNPDPEAKTKLEGFGTELRQRRNSGTR